MGNMEQSLQCTRSTTRLSIANQTLLSIGGMRLGLVQLQRHQLASWESYHQTGPRWMPSLYSFGSWADQEWGGAELQRQAVPGEVHHLHEDLCPGGVPKQPQSFGILHIRMHQQSGEHVGVHQELSCSTSNSEWSNVHGESATWSSSWLQISSWWRWPTRSEPICPSRGHLAECNEEKGRGAQSVWPRCTHHYLL